MERVRIPCPLVIDRFAAIRSASRLNAASSEARTNARYVSALVQEPASSSAGTVAALARIARGAHPVESHPGKICRNGKLCGSTQESKVASRESGDVFVDPFPIFGFQSRGDYRNAIDPAARTRSGPRLTPVPVEAWNAAFPLYRSDSR